MAIPSERIQRESNVDLVNFRNGYDITNSDYTSIVHDQTIYPISNRNARNGVNKLLTFQIIENEI